MRIQTSLGSAGTGACSTLKDRHIIIVAMQDPRNLREMRIQTSGSAGTGACWTLKDRHIIIAAMQDLSQGSNLRGMRIRQIAWKCRSWQLLDLTEQRNRSVQQVERELVLGILWMNERSLLV